MPKLLVVDDERGSRESLRLVFSRECDVLLAANADEALALLAREPVDLVLLDVMMPGLSGLELLRQMHVIYPGLPAIMISAATAIPPVVEAIRLGALDFVSKPFDVENLRHVVRRALETDRLHRQVEVLETDVARAFPTQAIVGRSPAFVAALDQLRQAAATASTVLIQGESGTGKELAARLLHSLSPRHAEPFVAVHCAALPENLLESELFGHEKGAFTGADRQKPGRFDLAAEGTIFFDEIGEMSPATQVKLLRVIQEREFMRVGGTRLVRTRARIVSASARDLRQEVAAGRFRDDLFYRIGVVPVRLPPLRERTDDLPLLIAHFLAELGPAVQAVTRGFDEEALRLLRAYPWPGNVRELRNVVERLLVLHGREPVLHAALLPEEFHAPAQPRADTPSPLPEAISHSALPTPHSALPTPHSPLPAPQFATLKDAVDAFERRLIEEALRQAGDVQTRAAAGLGTTRRILRYKMAKLGIADTDVPAPGN